MMIPKQTRQETRDARDERRMEMRMAQAMSTMLCAGRQLGENGCTVYGATHAECTVDDHGVLEGTAARFGLGLERGFVCCGASRHALQCRVFGWRRGYPATTAGGFADG